MIKDRVGRQEYDPNKKHDDWFDKCDLCDKLRFPQIGWCCEHDDPAHVTGICLDCLKELYKEHIKEQE